MFDDIKSTSTARLLEVKSVLDLVDSISPVPPITESQSIKALKGMFYVHIYGVFEYTVTTVVERTITELNSLSISLRDCKPVLLSLILNPECDALFGATNKKWPKRWSLFNRLDENPVVEISNDIFPTDGKNIRYAQLESIWTTFGVDAPILNEVAIGGRIKDMVENRNAIAHGNTSAAEIGGRVSLSDLRIRYDEMSRYISYIIDVFEDYLIQRKFIA